MTFPEVLQRIAAVLDRCGIPYMLTGSFASVAYGSPRSTQDIDLVIEADASRLRALATYLPSGEYYFEFEDAIEALKRESLFNVIDQRTGWKIDMVIRKSRPFSREEFSRRRPLAADGFELFIASVEDVILAKLEWSKLGNSRRQIEDAARILQLRWPSLDKQYLHTWVKDLTVEAEWSAALQLAGISGVNTSHE